MRFAIAVIFVLALAGSSGAGALIADRPTETDQRLHAATVTTPIMSVRRSPEALLRNQRDEALVAAVAGIPERTPGDSCLVITEGGRTVFAHEPSRSLLPASTQKLLLAAALLEWIDPGDTFSTEVRSLGPVEDGTIEGDVWIVGGGDPLLSTEAYLERHPNGPRPATRFEGLADALVAAGVSRIEGSILGDGSRYDQIRDVASWPQRYRDQVSAGPLAGLSVNDGLATFTAEAVPTNPGVPASDPPAHTARVLTELLVERGVDVTGAPGSGLLPTGSISIAEISSLDAGAVIAKMLQYSDNTTAELLMKELGVRSSRDGSTAAGSAAISSTLSRAGVRVEGVNPVDGSGLDLGNRVTCEALTDVLDISGSESALAAALAVSGGPGTLNRRLVDTSAEGRVRAKTGSLRHTSALAGFVDTIAGRTYTFAYISNLPEGQFMPPLAVELQDEFALAVVSLPDVDVPPELEPLPVTVRLDR